MRIHTKTFKLNNFRNDVFSVELQFCVSENENKIVISTNIGFKILTDSDFVEGAGELSFSNLDFVSHCSWDSEYEYTINSITNTGVGIRSELINAIISGDDQNIFNEIEIMFDQIIADCSL